MSLLKQADSLSLWQLQHPSDPFGSLDVSFDLKNSTEDERISVFLQVLGDPNTGEELVEKLLEYVGTYADMFESFIRDFSTGAIRYEDRSTMYRSLSYIWEYFGDSLPENVQQVLFYLQEVTAA
jgi:hypothetical protein